MPLLASDETATIDRPRLSTRRPDRRSCPPSSSRSHMESKPLDPGLLRSFSPLDGLKSENLYSLSRKTTLREMSAGQLLFKEGDVDKRTVYLVSGIVELLQ